MDGDEEEEDSNDQDEEDDPGEDSDDEAEEDYSRDEGGSETGGNEEEVVIISYPKSRKRAYSVCLYVSPPTPTDSKHDMLPTQIHSPRKSRIPRPINPITGIHGEIYSNTFHSRLAHPVIIRTPLLQTLRPWHIQTSRIPRLIAPSFSLRHAIELLF